MILAAMVSILLLQAHFMSVCLSLTGVPDALLAGLVGGLSLSPIATGANMLGL